VRVLCKGTVANEFEGTDLEHDGGKAGSKDHVAEAVCPVRVVGTIGVSHIGEKLDTVIHLIRMRKKIA
jgi:hypothetical protein